MSENVSVGIRIPKKLKNMFDRYCDTHGIRKNYLLTKIIEEKMLELKEDEEDLTLALSRQDGETIGLDEAEEYFRDRGLK